MEKSQRGDAIPTKTFYAQRNSGGSVFIKDEELFTAQGGHLGTWGNAWMPFQAVSLDHARKIAPTILDGRITRNKKLHIIERVIKVYTRGTTTSAADLANMILTALEEPHVRVEDLGDHMALSRDEPIKEEPAESLSAKVDYSALEYRAMAHLINEGAKARREGTPNTYRGNSLEHLLHSQGWLKEDLRLALIDASPPYARSQGFSVQDKESTLFKEGYKAGVKDAQLERKSAWQDWVLKLPIMQQSVLASAVRAPDGMRKFHPAKMLVRWYRRSVLVSAFDGKPLLDPHAPGGGSFTGPLTSDYTVEQMADEFMLARDEMSLHYYAHMMHAAQIIGCYHPDDLVRDFWDALYKRMVNALHLNTESYTQMARRLSDNSEAWAERSDEAGSCTD